MFGSHPEGRPAAGGWVLYAVGAALVLLQLVLGGHVSVFGASPDFLLALAAAVAFVRGARAGCVAGFACGLLLDLTGTGPVGLSALLGCVAGYILGKSDRNVLADGMRAPLATFAVAALAYNVAYLAVTVMLGADIALGWAVLGRLVASLAVDSAIGAAVFAVLARVSSAQGIGPGGFRLS